MVGTGHHRGGDRERVRQPGDGDGDVQHDRADDEDVHPALSESWSDIADDADAVVLHHTRRRRRQDGAAARLVPVHSQQDADRYQHKSTGIDIIEYFLIYVISKSETITPLERARRVN